MRPLPGGIVAEILRLARVRASGLLDSGSEERFDHFAELAGIALDMPVALVSIVGEDEQLFKGRRGIDICSSPRGDAFCNHAIETPSRLFEVTDTLKDSRFATNPMVLGEPYIRYYAGQPIVVDGHALGTLCVIDRKTRPPLDQRGRSTLEYLATMIAREIHQGRAADQLAIINRELRHRMGNIYALVNSIVSLLGRNVDDKDVLVERIRTKITRLGQTQSLLAASDWRGVGMSALAQQAVAPFVIRDRPERLVVQETGDFAVAPRAAFLLTLMLAELATNASKHGALAETDGTVHIRWYTRSDKPNRTILEWEEHCGHERFDADAIKALETGRKGFGSEILNKIVPADLRAELISELRPEGFFYQIAAEDERICDRFRTEI